MAKLLNEIKRLEQMKSQWRHFMEVEECASKPIYKQADMDVYKKEIRELESRIDAAMVNTDI